MADVSGLLRFWFGSWDDQRPHPENDPQLALWWGKNEATDEQIRRRFMADHLESARREFPTDTPEAAVANILLLDQFPRNAFRGTPHMFATDGLAQNATHALLASAHWERVPFIHRYFALMPLMHAEDLAAHDVAVARFGELVGATAALVRARSYVQALEYEHKHRQIIERFGRYPHRNATLGRQSTPEELTFLEQPGSSF